MLRHPKLVGLFWPLREQARSHSVRVVFKSGVIHNTCGSGLAREGVSAGNESLPPTITLTVTIHHSA